MHIAIAAEIARSQIHLAEKIAHDGEKTRDTVRAVEEHKLRDDLIHYREKVDIIKHHGHDHHRRRH